MRFLSFSDNASLNKEVVYKTAKAKTLKKWKENSFFFLVLNKSDVSGKLFQTLSLLTSCIYAAPAPVLNS